MFEEIAGLPLHPLAVHAAVVFVPSLALVALVYALVARWRSRVAWAAVVLSVVAPLSAVTAVLSGDAFQRRRGLPLEGVLADHRLYGQVTMWVTVGLGVATLLLVLLTRLGRAAVPAWVPGVLAVVVALGALAALGSAVLAGDSGARQVWEQLWQFTAA